MTKQVIAIGSVANDGNGDPLRDAMDKVNDNFTENYDAIAALNLITATPCAGSKYAAFRAAIKYFITKEIYTTDLFYVSKIENGVSGHVKVEVSKTSGLSAAGTVVMSRDLTTAAKTGWEVIALAQVGTSGLSGTIIIDWDKLTAATSYTCANWPEGALFAINLYKEGTTGGGGGTENIVISSVDTVDIDGSADQYVANPASADIEYTLKAFASMKGTVRINNISATYHVELFAAAAELATSTFNGTAQGSIIIEPKTYIEVAVYSEGVFYVKGTYTDTV